MKKAVLFLFFITSLLTAQTPLEADFVLSVYEDTHEVTISLPAVPYVVDYLHEAQLCGVNLENFFKISSIRIEPLPNRFGQVVPLRGKYHMSIDSDIPYYIPTFLEAVFYHEFYHIIAAKSEHCNGMTCPLILHDGKFIDPEKIIKTFNAEAKTQYFNYILKLQNEKSTKRR